MIYSKVIIIGGGLAGLHANSMQARTRRPSLLRHRGYGAETMINN